MAVLLIACLCAMGLATPTSIMVGTGRAAELSVLFRQGDALETLSYVQVVALDKIRTLTEGRPELTDFEITDGFDQAEVLRLVASAEGKSEHPIAQAIVWRAGGRRVAFVGDWVSDAPTLAHADGGIAIGTSTDVVIEAADIVLMSGDVNGAAQVLTCVRLHRSIWSGSRVRSRTYKPSAIPCLT